MKRRGLGKRAKIGIVTGVIVIIAVVAVILTINRKGPTPDGMVTSTFVFDGHYYPRYGDNTMTSIKLRYISGDTLQDQDLYVVFRAKVGGRDNAESVEVKGRVDGFGTDNGPSITWIEGTADVIIPYSPGDAVVDNTWEVVFQNTGFDSPVDILELAVVYMPSGSVLFSNAHIPAPTDTTQIPTNGTTSAPTDNFWTIVVIIVICASVGGVAVLALKKHR